MTAKPYILLVDPVEEERSRIGGILGEKYHVHTEADGRSALAYIRGNGSRDSRPALILLSARMPGMDGYAVLDGLNQDGCHAGIPVILMMGEMDPEGERRGLRAGASDVLTGPVSAELMMMRIGRILELQDLRGSLERERRAKKEQLDRLSLQSIMTIAHTIDAKDRYTDGRSVRVALCSREIAGKLGWDEGEIDDLYHAALLHDIGNIAVGDSVLNKTTSLTDEEYNEIKQHTVIGGEIVKEASFIPGVEDGVRYHHEHFDGKGYSGLEGDEIPKIARVIAVADAYEAMTSDRSYRRRLSSDQVREQLVRGRGSQFDPEVVDALLELLEEGLVIDERNAELDFDNEETLGEIGNLLRQVFTETLQETQSELEKDPLTGFLNRNYFEGRINKYLCKPNARGTFFMMDLDNFKYVNDVYGHAAGDALIIAFGDVLKENVRSNDLVCRMGGDEFAIFFPEMDKDHVIRQRAENIIRLFMSKRDEMGYTKCSVSIGIFTKYVGSSETSYEALYDHADKALYYVKNNGKDDYHFYSRKLDEDRREDLLEKQMDLSQLLRQVTERKYRGGAYSVEYDRFPYIYQFIVRNCERSSRQVQIILLTLHVAEDGDSSTDHIEDCLMLLETAIVRSLRRGDVTTRLSPTQQIVMLMDTNDENGRMVAERITGKYESLAGGQGVSVEYDIVEMPINS